MTLQKKTFGFNCCLCQKFHSESFLIGLFPDSMKENGRPRPTKTTDRKRHGQRFQFEMGRFTQKMFVSPSDSTQQEYSLHSYLLCFTEALKLEGMNAGLDFWVIPFWQVPLYIAGNVPKVSISKSPKKLLSLKIKTNFSLDLILENPSLQHFDVWSYGMPWINTPNYY